MASNGEKADFYLKVIGVLICILIGILSFVSASAISRNDTAHVEIKRMITDMSGANNDRIRALDERVTRFFEHAPPPHVHLEDGKVSRVVP